MRWSRRRLARQLAGRQVTAHVLTHAHFDHAGSSAWLCRTLGVPLWCGAGDAAAIASGRVDSHGSPLVNRLQRTLAPVSAHPVSRALREGDLVGGFEVLGLVSKSVGTASNLPFPLTLLPLLASGFVPTDSLPVGLRWFAENQPFTPIIETLRGLLFGTAIGSNGWIALGWCVLLTFVGYIWGRSLYDRDPQPR